MEGGCLQPPRVWDVPGMRYGGRGSRFVFEYGTTQDKLPALLWEGGHSANGWVYVVVRISLHIRHHCL
jgi:hypothetical protein